MEHEHNNRGDYGRAFFSVKSLIQKGYSLKEIEQEYQEDTFMQHLVVCIWTLWKCRLRDDTLVVEALRGKFGSNKSLTTYALKEQRRPKTGTLFLYKEGVLIRETKYEGSQEETIIDEHTPFEGKWRDDGDSVTIGLIVTSSSLTLKYLRIEG